MIKPRYGQILIICMVVRTGHLQYWYQGHDDPPWLSCLILCLLLFFFFFFLGWIVFSVYCTQAMVRFLNAERLRCHTVVYAWVTFISQIFCTVYAAVFYPLGFHPHIIMPLTAHCNMSLNIRWSGNWYENHLRSERHIPVCNLWLASFQTVDSKYLQIISFLKTHSTVLSTLLLYGKTEL